MASITETFAPTVKITVRTSGTGTVQVWGAVTGTTRNEDGVITDLEITHARVFDVAEQRWI